MRRARRISGKGSFNLQTTMVIKIEASVKLFHLHAWSLEHRSSTSGCYSRLALASHFYGRESRTLTLTSPITTISAAHLIRK